jgi:hypothetical protein
MTIADCDPNEDHEKYAGPVIPDPWDDDNQTDWPNQRKEVTDGDSVGSDEGPGLVPDVR